MILGHFEFLFRALRLTPIATTSLLLIVLLVCSFPARSEPIQLRPAKTIVGTTGALDPGDYAIPCVTDWNGDGRKDLLVGYRTADKVALYLNSGTDVNPVFANTLSNLQAGGIDIYVQGAPSCGAPAPWVCDFDSDGKRDLLVGSGLDGTVWFFKNTNTDSAPLLAPGVQLKVGSTTLSVSSRATPYVCDWDGDGLNDLLCGCLSGTVYFFKNTNTAQNPIFSSGVQLQAGGALLTLTGRSVVRVCDWDGDGLKDLLGSSEAGVYWCRNTNSNAQPILQSAINLKAPVSGSGLVNIMASFRMRLDLVDWNNDGATDLLLGNADGTVAWYEGYHFAFTNAAALAGGSVLLQWNSAPHLKYNVLSGSSLTNLGQLVATNLLSGGNLTCYTNTPGDPACFYRIQITP